MTVGSPTANRVRRFFSKRGRGRESASFGAAALGVLLLAGAALGNGISRTAVEVSDGLTWLGDEQRGEVVQVNPASGKPETRLQVSGADSLLDITQKDGVLVVLDRRTGQITVIDLATLLAGGRRQAAEGAATKVLLAENRLYIVDRSAGSVINADPMTLADIGSSWLAGQPLADAVTDEDGTVWAVDHGGTLHGLEWSDADTKFLERSNRAVPGAGPRTALVPHRQGVTLLGLEGGVVLQDGTGQDILASTAHQSGDVLGAQISPSELVPASIPDAGTVVLVSGEQVLRVNVADLGCRKPGRPAVFRDKIYVPCLGSGRVIVLDRSGHRGGDDVRTPGTGDPQLVFDDGRLFINGPGGEQGVIVDPDGNTRPVVIRNPELPVKNPDRTTPPTPPSPPRPDPSEPTRTRPNQPQPTTTDVAPGEPSTSGSPGPSTTGSPGPTDLPGVPPGISATRAGQTAAEITVDIRWGAAAANGSPITGYTVVGTGRFSGSTKSTQVTGTSAQLVIPCAGSTFCQNGRLDISVTAVNQAGSGPAGTAAWTVPQAPTTTTTVPPQPTTTTTTPPPPTTTTTVPPPTTTTTPPPAPVPSADATVITGSSGTGYTRTLTLAPPADWANHDGSCEVVNKFNGESVAIACSATSASIGIDDGTNTIVIRAHARDGSRSVDSAGRNIFKRSPIDDCGPGTGRVCPASVETVEAAESVSTAPMAGAGAGLIALAIVLRVGIRRREDEQENDQS